MAKPLPIPDLDPDRRLRRNARRILAVRIGEAWSYGPAVIHPGRVTELHDMRIAFKRLRYLLEIFQVAFPADLAPFIDEVKGLQDILGEIHDRDVQVPMLHDHLERLDEQDEIAARNLLVETAPARPPGANREQAFARFHARLEAAGTAPQRPGIMALLARRTRERDERYDRFLVEWRRLETAGFRRSLERALGID